VETRESQDVERCRSDRICRE